MRGYRSGDGNLKVLGARHQSFSMVTLRLV